MISPRGVGAVNEDIDMSRTVVLSIRSANDMENKIACIKGVRGMSGLGLKEAKDLVERVNPGHTETIHVPHHMLEPAFTEHVQRIRDGGLEVQINSPNDPARKGIADDIRRTVTFATMAGQYDIAKALIDVIETYCPGPSDDYLKEIETEDKE